ncbi:MAG: M56 family metallopeptidase, partial [Lachnospiraceae bacterium]|nr:M56 family metallopeptidase [Lachnospiraceae bacterium]
MEQILYNMLVCTGGIVITLILSCILARRYSVRWRYYVWLVFLLRLLLPMDISLPFAYAPKGSLDASIDAVPGNITKVLNQGQDSFPVSGESLEESEVRGNYVVDGDTNQVSYIPILNDTNREYNLLLFFRENVMFMIVGLWVVVALFLFGKQWLMYGLSMHRIRQNSQPVEDGLVPDTIAEIAARLKIRRKIYCSRCSLIRSPMSVGLLQNRILLPAGEAGSGEIWEQQMPPEAVEYVLRHELMHVRHCHAWIKMAASIVQAIYWFNPVIFFMRYMLDEDMEIICDNYVVKHLPEKERARYNRILLRCASGEEPLRYAAGFSRNQTRTLKRRFYENLLVHKRKRGGLWFVLVTVMLAASLMSVAWGRDLGALAKSERRAYADNYIEEYLCQDLACDGTVFPEKMAACGLGQEDDTLVAVGYSEENGGEIWRSRWFSGKWLPRRAISAETLRAACPKLMNSKRHSLEIFQGQDNEFYLMAVLYGEEGQEVLENLFYRLDIYNGYVEEIPIPQTPVPGQTGIHALRAEVFYDGNLLIQDEEYWHVYNPRKGSWVCRLEYQGKAGNVCAGNGIVYRLYLGAEGAMIYQYDEYSGQERGRISVEIEPEKLAQMGYAGLSCWDNETYFGCRQGLWCADSTDSSAVPLINGEAPGTLIMADDRNRMADIIPLSEDSF